jgi:hypothetical protein
MQITICGGGNAAHTLAGLTSAHTDTKVNVFVPFENEERLWQAGISKNGAITVRFPDRTTTGKPNKVSADPAEVLPGSDLVLLALPAFAHETIFEQIAPHLDLGAWVGAMPARGGLDWVATRVLREGFQKYTLFGLQTLPWACRIEEFGHEVKVMGTKAQVELAARPVEKTREVAEILEKLLGLSLRPVDCFLCLTLANTGQILHPGLMYGLFKDWQGELYEEAPLFYQGVTPDSAKVLQQLSDEIQALRKRLEDCYPCVDFSYVRPLDEWLRRSYSTDIDDPSTLETSLATNRSYAGLKAPTKPVEGGFVPDFGSRYLVEDVPYGLIVTRGIAELAGVNTPMMGEVIRWSQEQMGMEFIVEGELKGKDLSATRAPQRYGIRSLELLSE